MRELLFRNRQAEVALSDEISVSDERARRSRGEANYFAVEYTVDLMERSIYQEVAHSMAAVGMIAPFMEGVFKDVFERIGEKLPRGDLVKNILNVVERRGLKSYLPCELAPTMEALFRYRNDLFHWGFEWPAHIRQQFQDATSRWPDGWFEVATQDSEPWMFSMSMSFINHCMKVAEGELRSREQGVEIVVGRHRSCCLEMRILPLVTVMIARSSRAWRWLRIRSSTRVILWAMRTSGSRISPVWGLPWRWMSSP